VKGRLACQRAATVLNRAAFMHNLGGGGGGGFGGFQAAGLVGFMELAAGVAAGMAEAVGFVHLLPLVAGPTWVMGGVAMH
jgi:hypothetical protein